MSNKADGSNSWSPTEERDVSLKRIMPPAPENELDYKPLDGGWGWMVVVGAHISIGFAYSTPKVLSVFFIDIQEQLGASYSEVAWISSIMLAVMYAGGCGLSLNLNASLTIISKYFLNKRPIANGLAMAGSPVFLCVLAPANQYLLHMFGWRGSLVILGGLMLNCCVAGALMRPVVLPRKPEKVEERPNLCTKPQQSCRNNAKKFLDLTFFKDRGFVIYLIGNVFFIFGAYAPIVFLSAYAIRQGVEEYSAAYLLSIMGFVDMFVRPGTGLIASSKWIRPRIQYFFGFAMVFNGMCHLLCPLVKCYAYLVAYAIFLGVSFGMVFALIFECLMDLMGNERFPSAVGLVTIIECFPILLGPPTAGYLVDIYKDYKYLFFMCGGVVVTGGLFLLVMNIYYYHMLEKEKPAAVREQNQTKTIENQDLVSASASRKYQSPERSMAGEC
ncbi:monocarboxylate transporter 2-like isoform X2 [Cyclopterus lumpus]|uniref:monocarboxylate transporter 2-like isoform X2 n=1 Tax=Cyclopterus lumpus TaxID=8103 RepID=UPI0014872651|nr:monocarboxylate transporter 2-like isoform X2 [Cyclopterus lumpus]